MIKKTNRKKVIHCNLNDIYMSVAFNYVRKGLLAQDIVMVESEALKKSDNVTIIQKIKKIFS